MILTRKTHNRAVAAFVQGDSAGGSKLSEQTLPLCCCHAFTLHVDGGKVEKALWLRFRIGSVCSKIKNKGKEKTTKVS